MKNIKRVVVLGSSGAGKSTLSRALGDIMDLPVIHLDKHYWNPGWVETPTEEWEKKVRDLIKGEKWIIDGNFNSTIDMRLDLADTVIYLDFSTARCMYNVLKRWITGQNNRPDMAEGCRERFDLPFLKWVLNFRRKTRPLVLEKLLNHSNINNVFMLHSHEEKAEFLENAAQLNSEQ